MKSAESTMTQQEQLSELTRAQIADQIRAEGDRQPTYQLQMAYYKAAQLVDGREVECEVVGVRYV